MIPTLSCHDYRQQLTTLLYGGGCIANYQPGVGVTGTLTNTSWANQIGAAPALAEVAGSGPIIVSNDSVPKLYLPAVAGNTITTGNKTVTGNQTITFPIALDDYTPAADVTLFSKTSGNDGFIVKWLTTDIVRLVVGDGASLTNVDVVAPSGFTNGTQHTITIAWADGVGATFSYDGVQSGNQVAAAKTLTNAAVALTIGSTTSACRLFRFQVGSVYDMNPADSAETSTNGATFVSSTTGETYTLNSAGATPAMIARSPQYLFDGTADYLQMATTLTQPEEIFIVANQISYTRGEYMFDGGAAAATMALIQDNAASTGVSPNILQYAGALGPEDLTNATLGIYHVLRSTYNGASSSLQVDSNTAATGNCGAGNGSGMTVGAAQTAGSLCNIMVKEIIIINATLSAAERIQIQSLLKAIHGTP